MNRPRTRSQVRNPKPKNPKDPPPSSSYSEPDISESSDSREGDPDFSTPTESEHPIPSTPSQESKLQNPITPNFGQPQSDPPNNQGKKSVAQNNVPNSQKPIPHYRILPKEMDDKLKLTRAKRAEKDFRADCLSQDQTDKNEPTGPNPGGGKAIDSFDLFKASYREHHKNISHLLSNPEPLFEVGIDFLEFQKLSKEVSSQLKMAGHWNRYNSCAKL
jgi:hypothetical protein